MVIVQAGKTTTNKPQNDANPPARPRDVKHKNRGRRGKGGGGNTGEKQGYSRGEILGKAVSRKCGPDPTHVPVYLFQYIYPFAPWQPPVSVGSVEQCWGHGVHRACVVLTGLREEPVGRDRGGVQLSQKLF